MWKVENEFSQSETESPNVSTLFNVRGTRTRTPPNEYRIKEEQKNPKQ